MDNESSSLTVVTLNIQFENFSTSDGRREEKFRNTEKTLTWFAINSLSYARRLVAFSHLFTSLSLFLRSWMCVADLSWRSFHSIYFAKRTKRLKDRHTPNRKISLIILNSINLLRLSSSSSLFLFSPVCFIVETRTRTHKMHTIRPCLQLIEVDRIQRDRHSQIKSV